jgi:hypothetical protein
MKILLGTIAAVCAVSAYGQSPVSLSGKISGIVAGGDQAQVSILLKGDVGTTLVQLAPQWVLERYGLRLRLKDKVTVVGIRTKAQNKDTMIASSILRGRLRADLRDATGAEIWASTQVEAGNSDSTPQFYGPLVYQNGAYTVWSQQGRSGFPGPPILFPGYQSGNVAVFNWPLRWPGAGPWWP